MFARESRQLVGVEQRELVAVERVDRRHLPRAELKAEHVLVLGDAFLRARLRDGRDAALKVPPEDDLASMI